MSHSPVLATDPIRVAFTRLYAQLEQMPLRYSDDMDAKFIAIEDTVGFLDAEVERRHKAVVAALESLMHASVLPADCPHDNEPDICDACAYEKAKAVGVALSGARDALKLAGERVGE